MATSGVGISVLILGIPSHSMIVGSFSLTVPSKDSTTKPVARRPCEGIDPLQDVRMYSAN